MSERPLIAVVGATGAVGQEAIAILAEHRWPADRLMPLASARSAGAMLPYGRDRIAVQRFKSEKAAAADCIILCAGAAFSRAEAPALLERGATVIDNSSAFRLLPDVPLVIPEVNGDLLRERPTPRLIANPNCSTILLLTALTPWRRALGIESLTVSTYQAVSGAGRAAMEELRSQTRDVLADRAPDPQHFPEACAFNVFPHESAVDPDSGLNAEERKIIDESRRIWDDASVSISPTCVRVPVPRTHALAVEARLARPATRAAACRVLADAPGLSLLDDPARPPSAARATGRDEVLVGRVRARPGTENAEGASDCMLLWVCGDQLRKGAALNALQLASLSCPQLELSGGGEGRFGGGGPTL